MDIFEVDDDRVRKIGKTILEHCESQEDVVKKYTKQQLDLFRADLIISDGGYRLVGVSYFCPSVKEQGTPVLMGSSSENDEQGIYDELVAQNKKIVSDKNLYYELHKVVLLHSNIPEETYEDIAHYLAPMVCERNNANSNE